MPFKIPSLKNADRLSGPLPSIMPTLPTPDITALPAALTLGSIPSLLVPFASSVRISSYRMLFSTLELTMMPGTSVISNSVDAPSSDAIEGILNGTEIQV